MMTIARKWKDCKMKLGDGIIEQIDRIKYLVVMIGDGRRN